MQIDHLSILRGMDVAHFVWEGMSLMLLRSTFVSNDRETVIAEHALWDHPDVDRLIQHHEQQKATAHCWKVRGTTK